MDPLSDRVGPHRVWWLAGAGLLGGLASLVVPGSAGCIYPDHCIKVTSPGHDWCRNLANALQWPADGSIEDAQPVLYPNGSTPKGCHCFNDAENQILYDEVPQCQFDRLLDELDQAARQECQALVEPGYDHNCWISVGPDASLLEGLFDEGAGGCIGNCEYGGPPPGGSCPEPNPYECATGDGGFSCDGDDGVDTGEGETGSDDSEGALPDAIDAIQCDGHQCEVDEGWARSLYADPSLLVNQGAQLVFDAVERRHVFVELMPGTVLYTLGLRTGDRLEHINGAVIDGLDAALDAYVDNRDADAIAVRVRRGTRWVDLTVTFVP